MKHHKLLIALLLVSTSLMAQWTKGKGKSYYKLSAWYLEADEHYTSSGDSSPLTTRGLFNVNFYGEYGITDRLDIIAYIPFFVRSFQNNQVSATRGNITNEGAELNSFGDTDLGVRYGWFKNEKIAISSTLKFGLPFGDTTGGNQTAVLQNGDGEFNQQLQLDLGVPFKLGQIEAYGKTHLAYNHRTEGFSDEVYYGGELGLHFFKKLWVIGKLNILNSTKNGSLGDAGSVSGSVFANNIEFTNVGLEAAYYLTPKMGISINYTTIVSGRITAKAPSYSGGVFLDL